jgi:hypothetical protein
VALTLTHVRRLALFRLLLQRDELLFDVGPIQRELPKEPEIGHLQSSKDNTVDFNDESADDDHEA